MKIVRTEPTTGGEKRTPRDRIEPVFGNTDKVEPDAAVDASTSEQWEVADGSKTSRWEVQLEALRQFVTAAQELDSQASEEQADGSDEKGGIYTAFFNHGLVTIGEGDDDGDLNKHNFDRKVNSIRVRDEHGQLVPLPYGGTRIMHTISYLDNHYLDEFGDRPVTERPKRARLVMTDGELGDVKEFGHRLEEDHADKWPAEHWFIAVVGYGNEHDATLAQYNQIAAKHSNVHVYSFDSVTNSAEIAEDMAVAVLPQDK